MQAGHCARSWDKLLFVIYLKSSAGRLANYQPRMVGAA